MGLLNLAEIFSKSKCTPANPANPANPGGQISRISQISRGACEKPQKNRLADFAKLVDCLASHEGIFVEPAKALAMLGPVDRQVVQDSVTSSSTRQAMALVIVERVVRERDFFLVDGKREQPKWQTQQN